MREDDAVHHRHRQVGGHHGRVGGRGQDALGIGIFIRQMVHDVLREGDHHAVAATAGDFLHHGRGLGQRHEDVVHLPVIVGAGEIGVGAVQVATALGVDLLRARSQEGQHAAQRQLVGAAALRRADLEAALRQDGAHVRRAVAGMAQEVELGRRIAGAQAQDLLMLRAVRVGALHGGGGEGVDAPADLRLVVVDARRVGQAATGDDAQLDVGVFLPDQRGKAGAHGVPAAAQRTGDPFERRLRRCGADEGQRQCAAECDAACGDECHRHVSLRAGIDVV